MLLFLAGLIVGVIFGIVLIAILTSGAIADQSMEYTMEELNHFSSSKQNIITTKN
jgi:uncharacterized membrane-anchored protein YhcB (DUF1043 family)